MIWRLLSFLPEGVEVVLASQLPPKCWFLKDPPSIVKRAQRKTQITRHLQTKDPVISEADRVKAGAATNDIKRRRKGEQPNQNLSEVKKEAHTVTHDLRN